MTKEFTDPTCVWVYGKTEPGWYCAKWVWDQAYAAHFFGKPTTEAA